MSKCHFRGSKIECHIRVILTRVILGPIWACMGVNILLKMSLGVYKQKTIARQASYDVSGVTLEFQLHV